MNINKVIADEIKVAESQVEAAVKLIDEGCTIPFISRYRKEVTGGLNDLELRTLSERLEYLRELEDRKKTVISTIEEQGKLTKELKKQIEDALTLVSLEDLYRPYKPKKKTRATIALEKGLEPLAIVIFEQSAKKKIEDLAKKFIDKEKGVEKVDDAINGALDIIAEKVSDVADYRTFIRDYVLEYATIVSKAKDEDSKSNYEQYYHYEEQIIKMPTHRILAINRGEKEKVLKVDIVIDRDYVLKYLYSQVMKKENEFTDEYLKKAIDDSFDRLIWPSIENEVRGILTERAETASLEVFSKNLTQILMQAPINGKVVLGWDPAFRTGCKLAVCDSEGKVLATTVIYPTEPTTPEKMERARLTLKKLIDEFNINLISVGNGTASRESEMFIVDFLKKQKIKNVQYVIVNEAGASVYSASTLATEEFPNFDVGQRSAASIARRLQDPLAELVKIDPKSIGVGQYQHDMNQKRLGNTLSGVVESCVNNVGVDLNTASYSLLSYISGINKTLARSIVDYREKNGRFNNRSELMKVNKMGAKAFEQAAGFLRIIGGTEPLDRTGVHPESYEATNKLLKNLNYSKKDLANGNFSGISKLIVDYDKTANELKIGVETLKDIVSELEKPGRDPRDDAPKPILRSDILSMEDLTPGLILKGVVRNCIDFGIFVDIGVHQDGLVHISQISDKYIKHPLEVVSVGDVVSVKVISVDLEKKRISLTMRLDSDVDYNGNWTNKSKDQSNSQIENYKNKFDTINKNDDAKMNIVKNENIKINHNSSNLEDAIIDKGNTEENIVKDEEKIKETKRVKRKTKEIDEKNEVKEEKEVKVKVRKSSVKKETKLKSETKEKPIVKTKKTAKASDKVETKKSKKEAKKTKSETETKKTPKASPKVKDDKSKESKVKKLTSKKKESKTKIKKK